MIFGIRYKGTDRRDIGEVQQSFLQLQIIVLDALRDSALRFVQIPISESLF